MKKKQKINQVKTLFDHIKSITQIQDPKYWKKLSDADKRTWSTFMINRFLSMNPEWIQLISELDPYTIGNQLNPELVYDIYSSILPKSKIFLKYIKGKNEHKFNKKLIELIKNHFECSNKESIDYLLLMDKSDIENIISLYGYTDKEIREMT